MYHLAHPLADLQFVTQTFLYLVQLYETTSEEEESGDSLTEDFVDKSSRPAQSGGVLDLEDLGTMAGKLKKSRVSQIRCRKSGQH